MRRDPQQIEASKKLLVGRGATAKVELQSNHWYSMTIEIVGDRMRVSLDGEAISVLQSPGIAHPTKESVHFTVTGRCNLRELDDRIVKTVKARFAPLMSSGVASRCDLAECEVGATNARTFGMCPPASTVQLSTNGLQ